MKRRGEILYFCDITVTLFSLGLPVSSSGKQESYVMEMLNVHGTEGNISKN